MAAYTLAEARQMLSLCQEAHRELLSGGGAKSYRIGTRELTAFDLKELREEERYWTNMVEALSGQVRTSRVTRVVPRDL